MKQLLLAIKDNKLLWLLVFVPVPLIVKAVAPHSDTLLFVLSVLAIVPLAALLGLMVALIGEILSASRPGVFAGHLNTITLLRVSATRFALQFPKAHTSRFSQPAKTGASDTARGCPPVKDHCSERFCHVRIFWH